jgi:3-hydroxyisobutyrate dehydrogenase-like beta-hydroxyacid dehydrogenase
MQYIVGGPIPGGYARRIAAGDFGASNGFTVDLGLKDVSHIQAFAREVAVPLPVADVAAQHLLSAKARHGGHLDWGAIGLAVKDAAGVPATSEHGHADIGGN